MPKYYCEYCDIYLTHSSPGGRRQHNAGRKHINNKIDYFMSLIRDPNFAPPKYIVEMGIGVGQPGMGGIMNRFGVLNPSYGPSGLTSMIRPSFPPHNAWNLPNQANPLLNMMMGRGAPLKSSGLPPPYSNPSAATSMNSSAASAISYLPTTAQPPPPLATL